MSHEMELVTAVAVADRRPGARAAEPGDGPKHAALHTECLNCGRTLHGRFCSHCGQVADDHHRSILHLAWEAVEGFTHLDGRLAKTLPPLFLRPGSLARDHFEGRRQRHVPPFRLFLVSLLLFMLALEFLVHRGAADVAKVRDALATSPRHGVQALAHPGVPATGAPAEVKAALPAGFVAARPPAPPQIDAADLAQLSAFDAQAPQTEDAAGSAAAGVATSDPLSAVSGTEVGRSSVGRWFLQRAKVAGVSPEYFESVIFEWAHRLAVLLLPIFALLLTVCYVYKRKFYIYDHLIVSMQFLSFIFLVSAIAWILPSPVRGVAVWIATIWTPVNLFMILRGAYGSSILGAVVKTAALWVSTLCLFLALLVGILVVALGQMH